MRFTPVRRGDSFPGMGNTPFIDVIFQLVLFFVFTLSFILPVRWLPASLPKRGGVGGEVSVLDMPLVLELSWNSRGGGSVECWTSEYRAPDSGAPVEDYTFPPHPSCRTFTDPDGKVQTTARTVLENPRSGVRGPVTYDHGIPDLSAIEEYLAAETERRRALGGREPSVTVRFDDRVPWQAVVNIADICIRVGIEDYALGVDEMEP